MLFEILALKITPKNWIEFKIEFKITSICKWPSSEFYFAWMWSIYSDRSIWQGLHNTTLLYKLIWIYFKWIKELMQKNCPNSYKNSVSMISPTKGKCWQLDDHIKLIIVFSLFLFVCFLLWRMIWIQMWKSCKKLDQTWR